MGWGSQKIPRAPTFPPLRITHRPKQNPIIGPHEVVVASSRVEGLSAGSHAGIDHRQVKGPLGKMVVSPQELKRPRFDLIVRDVVRDIDQERLRGMGQQNSFNFSYIGIEIP